MQITVEIDNKTLEQAMELTGIYDTDKLITVAFKALIEREQNKLKIISDNKESDIKPDYLR